MKIKTTFIISLSWLLISCGKTNVKIETPVFTSQINIASNHQTIRGFGGATVFRPDLTDEDITTLFGNTNDAQLGLSILRIRISPFGTGSWGTELSNAQRAKALGAIVLATPWSPPASMKTNNSTIGGRLAIGFYSNYAAYLENFNDYMRTNNAELYAISVQNEPDIQVNYESCNWTAKEMTDFIRSSKFNLGNTKLMAAESFHFNQSFTDTILYDSTAASKISIIGGHIYGGGLQMYDNAIEKGKEVWMTEHITDTINSWSSALKTANEIQDCMKIGNYNAYIWWYLKRFYGPMDESGKITKRGYVMAQFSKYIRPGFQRIDASDPDKNISLSAYKEEKKLVLIAINSNSTKERIKFNFGGGAVPHSFVPHVTTDLKNLEKESAVNVTDSGFVYDIPASCIATFVSNE